MTPLGFVGGTLRVWRRDMESWRKYAPASLVGALGEPILSLLAIGYGLGRFVEIDPGGRGLGYAHFLAPGILASAAMNAASFEATFGSFTRMTEQKTYDAILATPIGIREIVAGDALWAASKATLSGTAVLGVAAVAGLVVSSRAQAYDFFTYYFTLVISVMYFFSGIFFPLASLPAWAQAIAWCLPLTHAVALSRACAAGAVGFGMVVHLGMLLAILGLAYGFAVRWVWRRLIA